MAEARRRHILVVEDDVTLRSVLAQALEFEGYSVATAANGGQAFGAIAARRPDLILLDLLMPVMDGWEFAELYLGTPGRRAPIVCITGMPNGHVLKAQEWAAAVIRKPFELGNLLSTVARLLGARELVGAQERVARPAAGSASRGVRQRATP